MVLYDCVKEAPVSSGGRTNQMTFCMNHALLYLQGLGCGMDTFAVSMHGTVRALAFVHSGRIQIVPIRCR